MLKDPNRVAYQTLDSYNTAEAVPGAFAGGTSNARGNDGGTRDPFTLFTVTGDVAVRFYGVCTTNLAGATATLEVGTSVSTAGLLAQTTATDIDAGEMWHDATPDASIELITVIPEKVIVNGGDIIETVGTASITSGNVRYVCLWRPLSSDGNVESTTTYNVVPTPANPNA